MVAFLWYLFFAMYCHISLGMRMLTEQAGAWHSPVILPDSSVPVRRTLPSVDLGVVTGRWVSQAKDSFRGGGQMAGDGTLCGSRLQAPSTCFVVPWCLLIKRKLKDKTTKNFNPTTTECEMQVGGPLPSVEFWANILAVCTGSPGHVTFKCILQTGHLAD